MIDYQKYLNKNMVNVLKDILLHIKNIGLSNNSHLYITFQTNHKSVEIPKWLFDKYPNEMTIVIQYEFYNLIVNENFFQIDLSFNNIQTNLKIGYEAIISFADPSANFGLILKKTKKENFERKIKKNMSQDDDNIINFNEFKKN